MRRLSRSWIALFCLAAVGCHDTSVVVLGGDDADGSDSSFGSEPTSFSTDTVRWVDLATDTEPTETTDSGTEEADTDLGTDHLIPSAVTWTMMFYMDADSNIEAEMLLDLAEFSHIPTPDWLNILVLFDRHPEYDKTNGDWSGTRLFKVDSTVEGGLVRLAESTYLGLLNEGDNEEKDMGDPATLEAFINFSMTQYPADHYSLIVSGHGNGWSKKSEAPASYDPKFICSDESGTSDGISIQNELKPLLENRGIDVLGFDACLMGMVEVAWAVKDSVQFMIASEANEASYGWDYVTWLTTWMESNHTPRELATTQVDSYQHYHEVWNLEPWTMTMAAVETAKLEALGVALNAFVAQHTVSEFVDQAMIFDEVYAYYYDLWHLADLAGDDNLKKAIEAAVISSWNSDYASVPGGLSIFFVNGPVPEYMQTSFCNDLDWC